MSHELWEKHHIAKGLGREAACCRRDAPISCLELVSWVLNLKCCDGHLRVRAGTNFNQRSADFSCWNCSFFGRILDALIYTPFQWQYGALRDFFEATNILVVSRIFFFFCFCLECGCGLWMHLSHFWMGWPMRWLMMVKKVGKLSSSYVHLASWSATPTFGANEKMGWGLEVWWNTWSFWGGCSLGLKEQHVASKRIGLKPVRRSNGRNLLRKSIIAGKQPKVHTTKVYQVLRCFSCRLPILPHHWYTFP